MELLDVLPLSSLYSSHISDLVKYSSGNPELDVTNYDFYMEGEDFSFIYFFSDFSDKEKPLFYGELAENSDSYFSLYKVPDSERDHILELFAKSITHHLIFDMDKLFNLSTNFPFAKDLPQAVAISYCSDYPNLFYNNNYYLNHYWCPKCNERWKEIFDSAHNDRCPSCRDEIEPTDSLPL